MMTIPFYKYQGTGNDFILLDNRSLFFDRTRTDIVAALCHRRFGIGADGLILLQNKEGYDFEMVYFNADGREGTMCGNGGRCIVQFAYDLKVIGSQTRFLAVDGPHDAEVDEHWVRLHMKDVDEIQQHSNYVFMNTGSPHYVADVQNIDSYDVVPVGKEIRYSSAFAPGGTNVNFMEKKGDRLFVRTYERGVEDETYSCGTGVTAAALSAALQGMTSPISVQTVGGPLKVSFNRDEKGRFVDIYLMGPAKQVFQGSVDWI